MLPVWTSVKVVNKDHGRANQAGVVHATNPETPNEVAVKFDQDLVVEVVSLADLTQLG